MRNGGDSGARIKPKAGIRVKLSLLNQNTYRERSSPLGVHIVTARRPGEILEAIWNPPVCDQNFPGHLGAVVGSPCILSAGTQGPAYILNTKVKKNKKNNGQNMKKKVDAKLNSSKESTNGLKVFLY